MSRQKPFCSDSFPGLSQVLRNRNRAWWRSPVGSGQAFDIDRKQLRIAVEHWHEAGLKQSGFAGAGFPFEKDQRFFTAQPDELGDVVGATGQVIRILPLEAKCLGAQQHRPSPAREAEQP